MILLGLLLGLVGYTKSLYTEILTFGNKDLFGGFPLVVVAVALLGLPEIFKNFQSKIKFKTFESTRIKIKFNPIKNFIASVIGFVGGLAPGMTTILSSQLAYMYSTLMKYSPVDKITASETANNAGSFSQLLPLMMLGIPLLSSEALVINLMESKGYNLISTNFESLFYTVGVSLIFINIIGLLIAWPGARYVIQILKTQTTPGVSQDDINKLTNVLTRVNKEINDIKNTAPNPNLLNIQDINNQFNALKNIIEQIKPGLTQNGNMQLQNKMNEADKKKNNIFQEFQRNNQQGGYTYRRGDRKRSRQRVRRKRTRSRKTKQRTMRGGRSRRTRSRRTRRRRSRRTRRRRSRY